jgi:glutathione S-transferase
LGVGWGLKADGKPMSLFESGAILLYLAEKTGKFLSHDPRLKWETIQWVFFQMANVGPYFGQVCILLLNWLLGKSSIDFLSGNIFILFV